MAKSKKLTSTDAAVIKPLIRVEGEQHVLESLFSGDKSELPTLKSIGYAKLTGTNTWVSYVITTKGKEVLTIEVDEPNLRTVAEESSKINFVNEFMTQGL